MREQFAAWYPLSPALRERFVTEGLVVLDTNVILDLYRMKHDARDDLLALLAQLGDRLWIPHQVGLEFHRNRLAVIYEQEQTDQKIRNAIIDAEARINDAIRAVKDHPVIDRAALAEVVADSFSRINSFLERARKTPALSMKAAMHADAVLDMITDLLDGRVGRPYPDDELAKVKAEAKRRTDQRIPPGFADAKKDEERAAGDYIIWRQTIDKATERKLPVLFITNDQKEDWYRRIHGLTVGPRIELINEMTEQAGVEFHAQTLARFIDTAPSYLRSTIKADTVSEVNRLDERERAAAKGDIASKIAEAEFRRTTSLSSLSRSPTDGLTVDILKLEARRQELAHRIVDLESELAIARHDAPPQADDVDDPRSYVRAVEARLATSRELQTEVLERLQVLRDDRAHVAAG